jgi:hypothetical protein
MRFSQLDYSNQIAEAGHPGAQAVAVEVRSAMADQDRSEANERIGGHAG